MESSAPVCSPTPIICTTILGKTPVSRSGSTIVRPVSMALRTLKMAFSTTALPEVRAVMSMASSMGTPLVISVPSVRVKRATAIFLIKFPSTGSFRIRVSTVIRPPGVP